MAASSGERCATVLVAAWRFLNNDATVVEESEARPRLLPARERKLRRVCNAPMKAETMKSGKVKGVPPSFGSGRTTARQGGQKSVHVRVGETPTPTGGDARAPEIGSAPNSQ